MVDTKLVEWPDFSPNRGLIEAASWRLVTELHRRFPGHFSIIEMHPGGGTYDCLALFSSENGTIAMFNRPGSMLIEHRFDGKRLDKSVYPIWPFMCSAGSIEAVDEVTKLLGLTPPKQLPTSTPSTLTYRTMSALIAISVFSQEAWQWRCGYLDTSDYGCGPVKKYFKPFPELNKRRKEKRPHDPLGYPEYRFWFLLNDIGSDPVLAMETTGKAYFLDQTHLDLVHEYRTSKSIESVTAKLLLHV